MRVSGIWVIAVSLIATACTEYKPIDWKGSGSWAEARRAAYSRGADGGLVAPGQHLVLPGETVYGLARAYGVAPETIVRINGLKPPHHIYVGQVLAMPVRNPPVQVARAPTPAPTKLARAPRPAPAARKPAARPEPVRVAAPPPVDAERTARLRQAARTEAPTLSESGFLWPVQGEIVSAYGKKSDGRRNDGINIAAPAGTPVRAADGGVVAYANDDLGGYGNMVLLRHAGGYTTAYAHNADLFVEVGDVVERGEVIAEVGRTGDVSRAQLHFEIRKGAEAVDPIRHLGSPETAVAARAGG